MLELAQVSARYGAIDALNNASMKVNLGEIVCIIGANGAGKSTVLNVISGIVSAASGNLLFEGQSLNKVQPAERVKRGIVQVPEGRLVFPDLKVLENLEMGGYTQPRSAFSSKLEFVFELFPRLKERLDQYAGLMSGGEQQMLAIGRALMANPKILLLDEPSMGLAPLVISEIFKTLRRLRDETKLTILLVEQNARAALQLSDRGYVLAQGEVKMQGTAAELLAAESLHEAFLGKSRAGALRVQV